MLLVRPRFKCKCGSNLVWTSSIYLTDYRCWKCGKKLRKGTRIRLMPKGDVK